MLKQVTISKEKHDNIKETLEILSDLRLLKEIKTGINDIHKGKTISL